MESNLLCLFTGEASPHGAVAFEAHARIRTEISKLLGGSPKILASPPAWCVYPFTPHKLNCWGTLDDSAMNWECPSASPAGCNHRLGARSTPSRPAVAHLAMGSAARPFGVITAYPMTLRESRGKPLRCLSYTISGGLEGTRTLDLRLDRPLHWPLCY